MKVLIVILSLVSLCSFSQKISQVDADSMFVSMSTGGGNGGEFLKGNLQVKQVLLDKALKQVELYLSIRTADTIDTEKYLRALYAYDFSVSEVKSIVVGNTEVLIPAFELSDSLSQVELYEYVLGVLGSLTKEL